MYENNQIIIYEDKNKELKLDVLFENDTLSLSQKQLETFYLWSQR
ncbi:MAG: hypothetical protein RBS91_05505 [Sulfurimonadaceae bacterium]|jgi:hypothetical protein|nr:hypothetical protein [Sulfurimonadaceae bacterium]